jgi:N-acetylmuramoyl-L-alanine amidase
VIRKTIKKIVQGKFKEKDLNLAIAKVVCSELERHKVEVKMSRIADVSEDLNDKIKRCNAFAPDFALDIHNNAGGGDGCEIFHHYGGGLGKTLATNVLAEIVKIGQNSRGAKTKKNVWGKDYYAFIRDTVAPAVIVECAFLDNKKDVAIIDTAEEQKNMAIAIAKGILKSLNILYIEPKKVEENKPETSDKIYRVQVGAYKVKANAEAVQKKLKDAGFESIIV